MTRTVLLTGASSGIGNATCRLLHASGFNLAITARRKEALSSLAGEIDPEGARILVLPGDLTLPADRDRWVERTVRRFGRLDVLINNAGYGQRGAVEELSPESIRANFETNVFSLLALTQACLPHLRNGVLPRIVNISSVAGRIARPLSGCYDATKHALEAFTDSLRAELRDQGIPVVSVMPGFILTEFSQTSRRLSASELERTATGKYAALLERSRAGEARLKKHAAPAERVAEVILRAVHSPRPRNRYAVPAHARVFLWARRFLPERLFLRLMLGPRRS